MVAGGALVVGVVLLLAGRNEEPQREPVPQRPKPLRIGHPATLDGVAYTVFRVQQVEPPEPDPQNRIWILVNLGVTNVDDAARSTTRMPPRLIGGNGRVYRVDGDY